MNQTQKRIFSAVAESLLLVLGTLIVPFFLFIDTRFLDNNVSEISLTEVTQEVLLFLSAAIFGLCAWRRPTARGFLVLVSGFFACMLIRELDALFDVLFYHGFWVWLVAVTTAASISYAVTCRGTVIEAAGKYVGTKSQVFLLIGMVVVLVLGRIMGSGKAFWRPIMGDSYMPLFKNSIQESLEFFWVFPRFLWFSPVAVPKGRREGRSRWRLNGRVRNRLFRFQLMRRLPC